MPKSSIEFAMAAELHEMWRKSYRHPFIASGDIVPPRMKPDGIGGQINIDQPFHMLTPKWQAENLAAAHAALDAVRMFPRDMEAQSAYIHDQWMTRNPLAEWNAAQHVPYDALPESEKEKDRVHARLARRYLDLYSI